MTHGCVKCGDDVPRDAVWCGGCGARVEVATSGRRRIGLRAGAAVAVTGVAIAATIGIASLTTRDLVEGPNDQPTVSDTRCDLDVVASACIDWDVPTSPSPVVIVREVMATVSGEDVVAIRLDDGAEVWRYETGVGAGLGGGIGLHVRSGLLVATLPGDRLAALDPTTGDAVWERRSGTLVGGDDDGLLVLTSAEGGLAGTDPFDGTSVWTAPLDPTIYREVAVSEFAVIAVRADGLQVFDRISGRPVWSVNDAIDTVQGVLGHLVVATLDPSPRRAAGSLVGYDLDTGRRLWTRAQAAGQRTVIGGDALYTQAANTPLERLDPASGDPLWFVGGMTLADVDLAPAVLDRGVPVVADRWLRLLDPATGEVMQESRVGRDGVTEIAVGRTGELIATTPDGLHRFPVDGPTRAEIDVIAGSVIAAEPLLVDTKDGRRVRVADDEAPAPPDCSVGLRRARCEGWTAPADGPEVVVTERVVVTFVGAALEARDVLTGSLLWRERLDDDPGARPVTALGTALVVAGRRTHGLDANTGALRWSTDGRHLPLDGLADTTIAVRRNNRVALIDVGTGVDIAVIPVDIRAGEPVGVTATVLVMVNRGGGFFAVHDRLTGDLLYDRLLAGRDVHTTASGLFTSPPDEGGVYRHDPETGEVLWGNPTGALIWPGDRRANRYLLVQETGAETETETGAEAEARDAAVSLLDPAIGAVLWTRTSAPVTTWYRDRGRLLLVTAEGVDVVDDLARLEWQFSREDTTVVNVDPLLVLDHGEITLVQDPTADPS